MVPPNPHRWGITSTYAMDTLDKNNITMLTPPVETKMWEVSIGFFISWVNKDEHSLVLPDCALGDGTCHIPFCQVAEKINWRQSAEGTWCFQLTNTNLVKTLIFFSLHCKMWSYLAQFQLSPAGFSAHTWFPSSGLLQSTCHSDFFQCCLQKVAIAEPSCHG